MQTPTMASGPTPRGAEVVRQVIGPRVELPRR